MILQVTSSHFPVPILAFPYAGKADVELVSGRIPGPSREFVSLTHFFHGWSTYPRLKLPTQK